MILWLTGFGFWIVVLTLIVSVGCSVLSAGQPTEFTVDEAFNMNAAKGEMEIRVEARVSEAMQTSTPVIIDSVVGGEATDSATLLLDKTEDGEWRLVGSGRNRREAVAHEVEALSVYLWFRLKGNDITKLISELEKERDVAKREIEKVEAQLAEWKEDSDFRGAQLFVGEITLDEARKFVAELEARKEQLNADLVAAESAFYGWPENLPSLDRLVQRYVSFVVRPEGPSN